MKKRAVAIRVLAGSPGSDVAVPATKHRLAPEAHPWPKDAPPSVRPQISKIGAEQPDAGGAGIARPAWPRSTIPSPRPRRRATRQASAAAPVKSKPPAAAVIGTDRRHLVELAGRGPARRRIEGQLPHRQIHRLDAVGALVDRRRCGHRGSMLGRARLLDVAHAAVDLDAERGDLAADVGADQALAIGVNRSSTRPSAAATLGRSSPWPRCRDRWRAVDRQMARVASVLAFIVISIRRTSGCSTMADGPAPVADRGPPWRRSSAKAQGLLIGAFGDRHALDAEPSGGRGSSS